MFKQGDQVVYGMHGVCNIMNTENRLVNRKKVEYYVLQPVEQPEARYYVPTQNQLAVSKMSPILTRQELDELLNSNAVREIAWISDENQRKQYYKTVINSGDRATLIGMIRLLYNHKKELQTTGRKFHLSDENFLRDAEKLLSGEFSIILNIPRHEVGSYIQQALESTN